MSEKMGVCTIVPPDQKDFQPRVFGMGILVRDREIVTCFHVITAALGEGWQDQPRDAVVGICFPLADGAPCVEGTVDKTRSFAPVRTRGEEPSDVAVIQLAQDAPRSVERARLFQHVFASPAMAYGFRSKEIDGDLLSSRTGQRTEGKIMGSLAGGRGQFDGLRQIGARVEHGFSGAGVYDPDKDAVVGMIDRSDRDFQYIAQFIDVPSLLKVIKEQPGDASLPPRLKELDRVVKALTNGTLVLVLGPSVNPKIYIDLAEVLVELVALGLPADPRQKEEAEKKFLKEHFGSACSICHYLPDLRPGQCPLLAGFHPPNQRLPEHLWDEQNLSVAKTNSRSLSQLYELQEGTGSLYDETRIIDIFHTYAHNDTSYQVLAQLVRQWLDLTSRSPFSLIVTTCIDSGLEEEFKCVKTRDKDNPIPFDLVWYVASGGDDGGYKYKGHATEDVIRVAKGDIARKGGSAPITILKLFGTASDHFLITQDQMNYFMSDLAHRVPSDLLSMLDNKNVLFLGFSPNDADVRAVVESLFPEKIQRKSWLIHRSIAGKLDEAIWRSYGARSELPTLEPIDITVGDVIADICDTTLKGLKAEIRRRLE